MPAKLIELLGDNIVREVDYERWLASCGQVTTWKNPASIGRVYVELNIEEPSANRSYVPGKSKKMQPERRIIIDLAPGETFKIDSDHNRALQTVKCLARPTPCKPGKCSNPDHPRVVMSGLAPNLVMIGQDGKEMPVALHAQLEETPAPTTQIESLHERTMRRLEATR